MNLMMSDNMPKGKVSPFWLYTDLVVAFFISFRIVKGKSRNLKSVKKQESAKAYERSGSLSLRRSTDSFVNRIVTQRTIKMKRTVPRALQAEVLHIQALQEGLTVEAAVSSDCPRFRLWCIMVINNSG